MGQYKTLDWTVALHSIMDSIFGLEFQSPGVRGHTKLLSSKVLKLLDVMNSLSVCCGDNEIGTNLVSYPDPSLGTRLIPIYHF